MGGPRLQVVRTQPLCHPTAPCPLSQSHHGVRGDQHRDQVWAEHLSVLRGPGHRGGSLSSPLASQTHLPSLQTSRDLKPGLQFAKTGQTHSIRFYPLLK